jgi:hypothetical protein
LTAVALSCSSTATRRQAATASPTRSCRSRSARSPTRPTRRPPTWSRAAKRRYHNIRIVLSHSGGSTPFLASRAAGLAHLQRAEHFPAIDVDTAACYTANVDTYFADRPDRLRAVMRDNALALFPRLRTQSEAGRPHLPAA